MIPIVLCNDWRKRWIVLPMIPPHSWDHDSTSFSRDWSIVGRSCLSEPSPFLHILRGLLDSRDIWKSLLFPSTWHHSRDLRAMANHQNLLKILWSADKILPQHLCSYIFHLLYFICKKKSWTKIKICFLHSAKSILKVSLQEKKGIHFR